MLCPHTKARTNTKQLPIHHHFWNWQTRTLIRHQTSWPFPDWQYSHSGQKVLVSDHLGWRCSLYWQTQTKHTHHRTNLVQVESYQHCLTAISPSCSHCFSQHVWGKSHSPVLGSLNCLNLSTNCRLLHGNIFVMEENLMHSPPICKHLSPNSILHRLGSTTTATCLQTSTVLADALPDASPICNASSQNIVVIGLTLIMIKIFIWPPKTVRNFATASI